MPKKKRKLQLFHEKIDEESRNNPQIELYEKLHFELFPEEYDYMYDSIQDAKDRENGISPMRQEYVDKVNARRRELGVLPYELKDDSPEIDVRNMESEIMISSGAYCKKVIAEELEKGAAYKVG